MTNELKLLLGVVLMVGLLVAVCVLPISWALLTIALIVLTITVFIVYDLDERNVSIVIELEEEL